MLVDRPNRFTLRVKFSRGVERVYFPNPGKLSTVVAPGREVLCEKVKGPQRRTRFNAFAIGLEGFYVTVNSSFANLIFLEALRKGMLEGFEGYSVVAREEELPGYGRIDFVLRTEGGEKAFVEVKSCTHVEGGVAKFPDRPTERGRRHLMGLTRLAKEGKKCHLVFVIQRPDARIFKPFEEVDQEFAVLLKKAVRVGVEARAFTTDFKPPRLYISNPELPIDLS